MEAIIGSWRAALLALLLVAPARAAENSFWGTDLEAARKTAARTNRFLLIHFSAAWCQPCQQLEREVLNQPDFGRQLQTDFVAVKLDYDLFPATRRKYGVQTIPTDVILSPQGQLIERLQSPRTMPEYVAAMTRIVTVARRTNGATAVGQTTPPPAVGPPVATAAAPRAAQTAGAPPLAGAPVAAPPVAAAVPPATVAGVPFPLPPAAAPAAIPTLAGPADGAPTPTTAAQVAGVPAPVEAGAALPVIPMPTTTPAGPTDRYADYFNRHRATAPEGTATAALPVTPDRGAAAAPALTATAAAPVVSATTPDPSATPVFPAPQDVAPIGLDGFCPVTLIEKNVWTPGDKRFGVQHRGRTYLFAGPDEQRRFQEGPDRYCPVMSGIDPVLAIDHGQSTPGQRMYGLSCGGRVYLFSCEQTLQQFTQNLNHYVPAALEARR